MEFINRPAAKAEARQLIRGHRKVVLGTYLLYFAIALALSVVDVLFITLGDTSSWGYLFISMLIILISAVLSAGAALFCMSLRRGEEAVPSMLFDAFGLAGKVIFLTISVAVRVFLWSLLFYIPGIVALYRYRFALYNLLENPELTAGQAIALSKIQTYGMKGQLFFLDLSFVGWLLLTILTAGLLLIWLAPYMQLADLHYYQVGKGVISPFPHGEEPENIWGE